MSKINFIRNRLKRQKLIYIGIDLGFIIFVAFILMFGLSIIMSNSSSDKLKFSEYLQTKVNELGKRVSNYKSVKDEHDKLLGIAKSMANIKASQHYLLLGVDKISQAITDGLYITNLNYIADTDHMVLYGEVNNLKQLLLFMKNLETQFMVKVNLNSIGATKNGKRSFFLDFKFGEENAFKESRGEK